MTNQATMNRARAKPGATDPAKVNSRPAANTRAPTTSESINQASIRLIMPASTKSNSTYSGVSTACWPSSSRSFAMAFGLNGTLPPPPMEIAEFVELKRPRWAALERLLDKAEVSGLGQLSLDEARALSRLYRGTSSDLLWVRARAG